MNLNGKAALPSSPLLPLRSRYREAIIFYPVDENRRRRVSRIIDPVNQLFLRTQWLGKHITINHFATGVCGCDNRTQPVLMRYPSHGATTPVAHPLLAHYALRLMCPTGAVAPLLYLTLIPYGPNSSLTPSKIYTSPSPTVTRGT